MNDYTYKLGFVFALTLHVALICFLLIKFTTSHSVALHSANVFINAVAVNEHDISQAAMLQQTTKLPSTKPEIKDLIQDTLQKNLLIEQAKEIAELKKEKQSYQKNIVKNQQQQKMQKLLQDQIKLEQKQLMDEKSKMDTSGTPGEIGGTSSGQSEGEVNKYKALMIQAISSQWSYSGDADETASGQLLINIAPNGDVLSVQLSRSSGNLALDRSAQAAVFKASPLPVPSDPSLFDALIKMTFTRHGFV